MSTSADSTIQSALTRQELVNQLQHIGLKEGMIVEVHSSLKSIGFVVGGATTVNDALKQAVGLQGTIVMPCQCSDNTEPLFWQNPPILLKLADKVRDNTPGYDVYTSDVHHMGALVENLRGRKDTCHSYHPNSAFIANGADAKHLMANQPISFPLYKNSPLEKMYDMDGYVLLIGTDYEHCTAMHLGECRSQYRMVMIQGGAVKREDKTYWNKYLDYDIDSEEFPNIGEMMERAHLVKIGKLGNATCRFFKIKDAVDYAERYFKEKG